MFAEEEEESDEDSDEDDDWDDDDDDYDSGTEDGGAALDSSVCPPGRWKNIKILDFEFATAWGNMSWEKKIQFRKIDALESMLNPPQSNFKMELYF